MGRFLPPCYVDRLELVGEPVPVLEGISTDAAWGAQFAVATNGTLVYLARQAVSDEVPISWIDQAAKTTPLRPRPANWSNPFFAPDGHRLAMDVFDGKDMDVWVFDLARDTFSRLTFDPSDDRCRCGRPTATGLSSVNARRQVGVQSLLAACRRDRRGATIDGQQEQPVSGFVASERQSPVVRGDEPADRQRRDDSADGRRRIVGVEARDAYRRTEQPLQRNFPMFSPDGRWLAYASDESGQNEVTCSRFPVTVGSGKSRQRQALTSGSAPVFSRRGRELGMSCSTARPMAGLWSCRTPSRVTCSAPTNRGRGRQRDSCGVPGKQASPCIRTAIGSPWLRFRKVRLTASRTRSSSSSTSSTSCAGSRRPHRDAASSLSCVLRTTANSRRTRDARRSYRRRSRTSARRCAQSVDSRTEDCAT